MTSLLKHEFAPLSIYTNNDIPGHLIARFYLHAALDDGSELDCESKLRIW